MGKKKKKFKQKHKNKTDKSKGHKSQKKRKKISINKIILGAILYLVLTVVVGITIDGGVAMFMYIAAFASVFIGLFLLLFFKESTNHLRDFQKSINQEPFFSASSSQQELTTNFSGSLNPFHHGPIPYHLALIILAIIGLFFFEDKGVLSDEGFSWFAADFWFQLVAALMFSILGVFNPFIKIPEEILETIKQDHESLHRFLDNTYKSVLIRSLICILVVVYFIWKDWLVFPSFEGNSAAMTGVDLTLLMFFVRNIYMMQQLPIYFLKENILRFFKLKLLLTSALFLLVPMVPVVLLGTSLFGGDLTETNLNPLFFIGFNVIAVWLEYHMTKDQTHQTDPQENEEKIEEQPPAPK